VPGLQTQAFTTFGTTGSNHCTATFGFHAHQKAMGTCTTGFRWLVGTFHYLAPVPSREFKSRQLKSVPASLISQQKFADFKNP
jgi:hypothetical protein